MRRCNGQHLLFSNRLYTLVKDINLKGYKGFYGAKLIINYFLTSFKIAFFSAPS